jgi:ribosome-associated translation inhibitor RaiA
MKLTLQHHQVRSSQELDSLIEDRILALQPQRQIDEATVRLECHFERSPAYRVQMHLVTPGPDLFAEGRDHTLRAAMDKAMARIEADLAGRAGKRQRRQRSRMRGPARRSAPRN